jgi:peptide/nickel transport system substrate-binding protein
MKKLTKVLALLLVLSLVVALFASCKVKTDDPNATKDPGDNTATEEPYIGADTLVVGYANFSGKFSPFFATTAYDQDVAGMTSLGLISTDREGNVVYNGINGEVRAYNGTDYTYYGISDVTETINDNGTVDYVIKMKEGVKFSDGKEMTADDAIFSMYVLSDPTYNGSSSFSALPIVGMEDYLANMKTRGSLIVAAGPEAVAEGVTKEDTDYYWNAFNQGGENFAQSITDYVIAQYLDAYAALLGQDADTIKANDNLKTAFGMALWGFGDYNEDGSFTTAYLEKTFDMTSSFPTKADYWADILAHYGYNTAAIDAEKATDGIGSFIDAALGDKVDYYSEGVSTGNSASSISGIQKIDNYQIKITMSEFDATAIYQIGIAVAPLHYYGDASKFDIANNSFGFTKGDLSSVRAKTTAPMGAGPYKFVEYTNGVVTFERNTNYFLGTPKITYIKFQETQDADKVPGVQAGTFDVTDPSFNDTAVNSIKGYNSNGELTGNVITTSTVDNLGYGYIGANADNVKVGNDKSSAASKALRRAFATMFAVNREKNIYSYYRERAAVIQYPISNTSWAAPKPNDQGYELAYSKDVDGNQIYTATMSDEEKISAALQAAIGFFKAAGYTWDDAAKKFTAAPEGAKMEYEVIIPADGVGDHPAYGVVADAKEQLATIGITLTINDPSDSNILWDALDAGTQDFWAAAWGAAVDPDMYQVYYSQNVVGIEGSSESNHYRIQDSTLDQLIMDARKSADHAYRKSVYKQCLDIIMDWAVEIPTYQRQNAIIFSTERVNISTLTPDITTFWGWMNDIEKLEMNPKAN